jgi:hypothetical protein
VGSIRTVNTAAGQFVMLTNQAAQDKRLSWQARGIIYFVLSLPPDHHLTATWLETQAPNGRQSVRSALAELKKYGYYRRTKTHDGNGKWSWDQVISDSPSSPDSPPADSVFPQVAPCDGFPADGSSADGSPANKELKTFLKDEDQSPRACGPEPELTVPDGPSPSMTDLISAEMKTATGKTIDAATVQHIFAVLIGRAAKPPNWLPTPQPPSVREILAWRPAENFEDAPGKPDLAALHADLRARCAA